jgi:hypothetical protein
MLGLFKSKEKPTSEQIKIDREKWLQDMLDKSGALNILFIVKQGGWNSAS